MNSKTVYTFNPTYNAPGDSDTDAIVGESVDRAGWDHAKFCFGINGGTNTLSATNIGLQESDDASTWTNVAGATGLGTLDGGYTANVQGDLDLRGNKRYIRAVAQISGTGAYSSTFDFSRGESVTTAADAGASGYFAS